MRFLAIEEGSGRLNESFGMTLFEAKDWVNRRPHDAFLLPKDSGVKTALAREVCAKLRFPSVLWTHEYGIWDSSENRPLLVLLRRALEETRPLEEAPVTICEEEDRDSLWALLSANLYFVYGCVLVEIDAQRVWLFSHDEWVAVRSDNDQSQQEAVDLLRRFELEQIESA